MDNLVLRFLSVDDGVTNTPVRLSFTHKKSVTEADSPSLPPRFRLSELITLLYR